MTAEGSVYQHQSDGRWVAQYTDAKGKVRYLYRTVVERTNTKGLEKPKHMKPVSGLGGEDDIKVE